jgi:mannose-1-phosphate guanylyltransferase/mannose-6-phosphate isomerase
MLEPMGRNTAPAVTLAALQALETGSDPVLVVTPADQTVTDGAAFNASLRRAVHAVRLMAPSTSWASRPTGPKPVTVTSGPKTAAWRSSWKNPTCQRQRSTCADGRYFWNAGMFVLQGQRMDGCAGALSPRHRQRLPRGLCRARD